jgi:hypothetical protein
MGHLETDRASRYRLGSTVVANRGCRVRGSRDRRVRGSRDRRVRGSRRADRLARRVRDGSHRAVDRPDHLDRRDHGSRRVADHRDHGSRRVADRRDHGSRRVADRLAADHLDRRARAAAEVRPDHRGHIVPVGTACMVRRWQRLTPD